MLFQIDPSDFRVAAEKAHADLAQAHTAARKASVQVPITSAVAESPLSVTEAGVEETATGVTSVQATASRAEARKAQADRWKAQRPWRWWSCR